jgi:hypothetical protein
MAGRDPARGASEEHHRAEERVDDARESRDAMEDRRAAAHSSGDGEFEAAVELRAAEEQLAAREAWARWIESDR